MVQPKKTQIQSNKKQQQILLLKKMLSTHNKTPHEILLLCPAKLASQRYAELVAQQDYDSQLSEIFTNAGYVIKPNITVNGFTTNLFAIGTGEKVWFGAINCDLDKFKSAVNRLNSIFTETLEDVPINVSAFILDTKGLYNTDNTTLIFHTLDELKEFMATQPNPPLPDSERENFDAYSNYIDTVIQYAKNA